MSRGRWLAALAVVAATAAAPRAQAPMPAKGLAVFPASGLAVFQASGLAVFDEVWRTINDSFFDPAFGGLDWAGVRDELRPKAAAAASIDETRAVINALLARLGRSHFALLPASAPVDDDTVLGGEGVVDLDFRLLDGEPVVTTVGGRVETTGPIRAGARIAAVDGRPFPRLAGTTSGAVLHQWRRVNAALHGLPGTVARLEIVDPDGAHRQVTLPRRVPDGQRVQYGNLPPLRVRVDASSRTTPAGRQAGVIAFNIWMAQIDAPVAAAVDRFRGADGLIVDLRGNAGGLAAMIMGLAGHVIDRPDVLGTMRTRQVPQFKFIVNPRRSTSDGRVVAPYAGPVAILVDEMTASASECFAGALQDLGRARIFGRRSAGAALPASTRTLGNGDVLEYVIGDFVTSTGRSLEGPGVTPDEIQPLSIASLAAGHDDALRAALAWIDRQRSAR